MRIEINVSLYGVVQWMRSLLFTTDSWKASSSKLPLFTSSAVACITKFQESLLHRAHRTYISLLKALLIVCGV
jgi:hypothetical protein